MKVVNKPWGKEEVLVVEKQYVVKRLYMHKGQRCSLQYHDKKTETIYVLSGILLLHINGRITTLTPNDFYTILPGEVHRMEGKENVVYLESSTPELDDVVRIGDDYGRK